MAKKEKVSKMEARIAPSRIVCIWFDGDIGQEDDGNISCAHVGHPIPRTECPQCNGLPCEYTAKFIHIIWEDVEAGPNGEIVTVSSDNETVSITSNEEF